jgi:hypothetical protein
MARLVTISLALMAFVALPLGSPAAATHSRGLNSPHALHGEKSCGATYVAANSTSLLVFTRHVGCRKAVRLVHKTTKGYWPTRWWPRQDNHKVWIQRVFATWHRSALRRNRHIRALDLPLGSHTLAVGAGDIGSAQYKPVYTALTGDGGFQITHTKWSSWTRRHARGQGIGKFRTYRRSPPYFHRVPAKLRAYRPRTKCGTRVFTRYEVRVAHRVRHFGQRHFVVNRDDVACND